MLSSKLNISPHISVYLNIIYSNSDNDKIWLECSEIRQNGYKINNINRKDRKGWGLAIIYKNHLKVNIEKNGCNTIFWVCIMDLKYNK